MFVSHYASVLYGRYQSFNICIDWDGRRSDVSFKGVTVSANSSFGVIVGSYHDSNTQTNLAIDWLPPTVSFTQSMHTSPYGTVVCCGGLLWWPCVVVGCGGRMWWSGVVVWCGGLSWWPCVVVWCGGRMWWSGVAVWCGGRMWWSGVVVWCGDLVWWPCVVVGCGGRMWWSGVVVGCGGLVWWSGVVNLCRAYLFCLKTGSMLSKFVRGLMLQSGPIIPPPSHRPHHTGPIIPPPSHRH
ncbi:hypothetical protein Btru_044324 [Bulinus truncatus]|nr:hypothetical protein Btru_044324 [Bulinus truncatus]